MATPTTYEQFVAQATESSLLSAEDITVVVNSVPKDRRPKDGEQLARELVRQNKLTVYQAQQLYAGKGKELVRGNYVILDKLGKGGMGVVYKAEHKRMRRQVALKVLSPQATKSPEAVKRFHREVEAAAKLNHPNIVAAYDADESGGTHFLVMEYVEGDDLSNTVKKNGPLSIDKAVNYITQAARGLEFAHQRGVIHRDIKPANMLLDAEENVKILDMGLARFESDAANEAELTSTGQVMGTVDYMAPEQALSTKQADHRSDIYSLGISLWFLLTGRAAYGGDSLMARMLAHREQPIPSLLTTRNDAPKQLDAVFAKMIAKNAKDRYQSMGEVVAALEACRPGSADRTEPQVKKDEDRLLGAVLREQSRPEAAILPVAKPLSPDKPAAKPAVAKQPLASAAPPPAKPEPRPAPRPATAATAAPPPPRSKTNQFAVDETMNTGQPSSGTSANLREMFNVATPAPLPTPLARKVTAPWWQDQRKLLIGGIVAAVALGVLLLGVAGIAFFSGGPDEEVAVDETTTQTTDNTATGETTGDGSKVPPVAPIVPSSASSIVVLDELGVSPFHTSPWPSSDGLRLYYEGFTGRGTSGHGVLKATRVSDDARFGEAVFVANLRHPCLTADELNMVGIDHNTPAKLVATQRVSRDATFAPPGPLFPNHPEAGERHNVKSPFIAPDGRVLLFQRTATPGNTELMAAMRSQVADDRWQRPFPMPHFNEHERGKPPTWPSMNANGLLAIWSQGGDREAEVWTAHRGRAGDDFVDFAPVMVDGKPLVGRSPRWCEKTGELFFAQPTGSDMWQLAVLKDFWPQGKPASAISSTPTIAVPPIGFTPLFNGRDLAGWEVMQTSGSGADQQNVHVRGSGGWSASGGVLTCSSAVPGWLKTLREYDNFILQLEYRMPLASSNSGIYIRSPDTGHLSNVGMEVQILEGQEKQSNFTGDIVRAAGASGSSPHPARATGSPPRADGLWNQLEISCDGDYVQVKLNGTSVAATSMATNAALRDRPRKGFIGLANWMGQAQGVEFRNIWIKELPASGPAPIGSNAPTTPVVIGTSKFNGHEYKFFSEVLPWKEARGKCVAVGGDLAVIDSLDENTFVGDLVAKGGGTDCWIGATDEAAEGVWVSPSGARLAYFNWFKQQPNNSKGVEHFGLISNRTFGTPVNWQWVDQPNVALNVHTPGFMCEWSSDSAAIPAPSGAGWRDVVEADFVNVNTDADTWKWVDGNLYCSGTPTGVLRTKDRFTEFEFEFEWRHVRSGGNAGALVWVGDNDLAGLEPGKKVLGGIELQILDEGYTADYKRLNPQDSADWFTTHGDVLAVGKTTMKPFPPVSPRGVRSLPKKHLCKPTGEWNKYSVRCVGGEVRLSVNGEEVSGGSNIAPAMGYICLQSEGSPVVYRNLRVREVSDSDGNGETDGWIDLFNGRDLAGWREIGTQDGWKVEAGVLAAVGKAKGARQAGWLMTDREFVNFELQLEFSIDERTDSGVAFRCDPAISTGNGQAEIQIVDQADAEFIATYDRQPFSRTGSLAGLAADQTLPAVERDRWHTMKLFVQDRRLQATVDGLATVDSNLDEHLRKQPIRAGVARAAGPIGLQRLLGGVRYRNIRIRDLGGAPATPPAQDWVELFSGKNLDQWSKVDGKPAHWRVINGYTEVTSGGSIRTKAEFGPDFELAFEFWLPSQTQLQGQARANSGVYLIGRHEVQICDAYNNNVPNKTQTCGAIYNIIAPEVDAIAPPQTWQSMAIAYRAPRWLANGALAEEGHVTIVHNEKRIIADGKLSTPCGGALLMSPGSRGPIVLQDHGNPVRFRNIRLRER